MHSFRSACDARKLAGAESAAARPLPGGRERARVTMTAPQRGRRGPSAAVRFCLTARERAPRPPRPSPGLLSRRASARWLGAAPFCARRRSLLRPPWWRRPASRFGSPLLP